MEEKINVAAILNDKPKGTKLYSSACGKCKLEEVDDKSFKISFYNSKFGFMNGGEGYLDKNGKLYDDGECVVFPSKEMRDWRKFAWKNGDVLVSKDRNVHIIFEKFEDDAYTKFRGKYYLCEEYYNKEVFQMETSVFEKATDNDAQTYINNINKCFGGKLNLETLEIEKETEFKDGDIVFMREVKSEFCSNCIFILRGEYNGEEKALYHAFYNADDKFVCARYGSTRVHYNLRLATEEEKKQLFSALEKEGKRWDSDKKAIVDLKPKVELKPFDKVLIRDFKDQAWQVSLFGYKDANNYYCCNGSCWNQCIPYIGNESLLGTTKDVEG